MSSKPQSVPNISDAVTRCLEGRSSGDSSIEAASAILREVAVVQDQIRLLVRLSDHARLFWNQVASPGGELDDDWPAEDHDLLDILSDFVEVTDPLLVEQAEFSKRLTVGAGLPPQVAECISTSRTMCSAIEPSFKKLIQYIEEKLPSSLANDKARYRFFRVVQSEIDAVHSNCSDAQESAISLTVALLEVARGKVK